MCDQVHCSTPLSKKQLPEKIPAVRPGNSRIDGGREIRYTGIGLLFAPVICLLCAGWFFVRWKNEHENQKLALRDRKTCFVWLIAAAASLVIFGVLKLLFPITA